MSNQTLLVVKLSEKLAKLTGLGHVFYASMAQLQQNIAAYQVKLTPDILKEIDAIHLRYSNPAP